jgi:hypothetical protein
MNRRWIKLHLDILDDPKMGMLDELTAWLAVRLFMVAGKVGDDGRLPELRRIAWMLRMTEERLASGIQELMAVDIVTLQDDGCYYVTNFEKRQANDSAAERVRNSRVTEKLHESYQNKNKNQNRLEENRVEVEAESFTTTTTAIPVVDDEPVGILRPLADAFTRATHLPEGSGGHLWVEGLQKLYEMGASPGDITLAVAQLTGKNYTISSPVSLINAVANVMRIREERKPTGETGINKYLRGYADHIKH